MLDLPSLLSRGRRGRTPRTSQKHWGTSSRTRSPVQERATSPRRVRCDGAFRIDAVACGVLTGQQDVAEIGAPVFAAVSKLLFACISFFPLMFVRCSSNPCMIQIRQAFRSQMCVGLPSQTGPRHPFGMQWSCSDNVLATDKDGASDMVNQ